MADLGCADGVHSFPVLSAFLSAFETPPSRVGVFHVDLPTSDLPGLLKNLYEHPQSYVNVSGGRAHPILRSSITRHLQQGFAQHPDRFAVDNVSLYLGATKL